MVTPAQQPNPPPGEHLESTAVLLARARDGDERARDRLFRRYVPELQRLAHGRLPQRARDLFETNDLVQETLIRAFNRLGDFEPRREGAFLAYLRQILFNRIRDEGRRAYRVPDMAPLPEDVHDDRCAPLESLMGRETLEAYDRALDTLSPLQREAFVMRYELGWSHRRIGEALENRSAGAARQLVVRAIGNLAERLRCTRGAA